MAAYQSHISFSAFVGVFYAATGFLLLGTYPEVAILSAVVIIIAGMLPDIDASQGAPARELAGLLAAISPLVLLELFPQVKSGGVARIALVVIGCYFITRIIVSRGLQSFTSHRGLIHSIPAAIITFQLTYLLFRDMFWQDRLFIAFAGFLGFFSHLLLDSWSNLDLVGKAMGKDAKAKSVMKLSGGKAGGTIALYACILVLGWIIARDFYPNLSIFAGVNY